jgi:hypothetical protein
MVLQCAIYRTWMQTVLRRPMPCVRGILLVKNVRETSPFQGHFCRPDYLADADKIVDVYINAGARRGKARRKQNTHCHTDKQTGESGQRKGEKGSEQRQINFISFSPLHLLPFLGYSYSRGECLSAEQLQAWRWAWPEWRRYSCSPSSPGPPPTPTPTTVSDSCSPSSPISPQLKRMFGLACQQPLPPCSWCSFLFGLPSDC